MEQETFLVIHVDNGGKADVAEVYASSASEAIAEVAAYPDTSRVDYAISMSTETVYDALGNEVVPTEGDAMEPEEEPEEEHEAEPEEEPASE